jgi:hypothetical protein
MHGSDANGFAARLDALERQNRQLKAGGAALLIAVCAAVALDQVGPAAQGGPSGRSIQVEKLTIVDPAGKPRVSLGVMDNEPFLVFHDGQDRVRMVLSNGAEGSSIQYYDTGGKRRIALAETGAGAGLEFYDPQERRRVGLLTTAQTPTLVFSDSEARTRMLIGIGDDGPDIEMFGPNAKRRVALGALQEAGPRFALFDQDGLVRLAAGVAASGPALILSDDRIQPRMQLDVGPDGPGVTLKRGSGRVGALMAVSDGKPAFSALDPNGKTIFSAP